MYENARGDLDPDLSASQLLRRCADGDSAAFRRLYQLQAPRLFAIAVRLTGEAGLAADAVQDAFVQAWRERLRFDPARGTAEAWLAGLVRFRAIDIGRKRRREQGGFEAEDSPDLAPGPLDELMGGDEARALHQCLGTLDERQRRAVTLAFVDGLSHAELAARLKAPLGTVKSWVRRGLLGLRLCLQP